MSAEAMVWAWKYTGTLPDGEALLLMALADVANTEGYAFPGQQNLARKCGCSERTIRRRLASIEELGLLTRTRHSSPEGREFDGVILDPESEMLRKTQPDKSGTQPDKSGLGGMPLVDPNTSDIPAQPDNPGTPPANRCSSTTHLSNLVSSTTKVTENNTRSVDTPQVKVDSLKLTTQEWQMAERIIWIFNAEASTKFALIGSRGRPTEHLKRIVGRLRDNPEVTLAEHEAMIKRVCAKPWWSGKPGTVGVIYSPAAFARSQATDDRPVGTRNFKDERRTPPEKAPW